MKYTIIKPDNAVYMGDTSTTDCNLSEVPQNIHSAHYFDDTEKGSIEFNDGKKYLETNSLTEFETAINCQINTFQQKIIDAKTAKSQALSDNFVEINNE
jgi:hypothetical protein